MTLEQALAAVDAVLADAKADALHGYPTKRDAYEAGVLDVRAALIDAARADDASDLA